ncbi:MAG: acyl-CoA dehydrogenase family protein [Pseudomonadota bacterium]
MYNFMLSEEANTTVLEVRDFIHDEVSPEYIRAMDRDEILFPREFVENLGQRNLLGLRFAKNWGGRELPWTAEVAAIEEVGVLGTALCCAYVMPSIVGEALDKFGTESQKEKYLKPLLAGKLIAAEALTEPRGGSDFFGATTRAVKDGDEYIITGQKRFVVGAEGADFFIVYCRTNPDPNAHPHNRISLFLVERGPGVEVEYRYGLMGTRGGGTGRLVFREARVPAENLLGAINMGALIFNQMMIPERLTSAAGALGVRGSLEVATRYSDKRTAFGQKIRKYQAISFMIGDGITKLDAARALVYMAARAVDTGAPNMRRLVSEAKKFATDAAWEVANIAMQVLGGIGYTDVYPIEKAVRDIRIMQIWTGTNEIMNLLVQHEYYGEVLADHSDRRNIEDDAMNANDTEKVYVDEDQEKGL